MISATITPISASFGSKIPLRAVADKWIDSSISETANVPTDFPFDDLKDIYLQDGRVTCLSYGDSRCG